MNHSPIRHVLFGIVGSAVALMAVTTARCDDDNARPAASDANPAPAGMMAAKDPETGALVPPSPEQMAALAKQQARQAKQAKKALKAARKSGLVAPAEKRLANGTVLTTLDATTEVYEVAVKNGDGKVRSVCVPADKVDATLKAGQEGKAIKQEVLDEK